MPNDTPLHSIQLLDEQTTSAAGNYVTWQYSGRGELQIAGVFDGASIALTVLAPDNATEIAVNDADTGTPAAFTTLGTHPLSYIARGQQIRATVSGAGASTSLSAWIVDAGKVGY